MKIARSFCFQWVLLTLVAFMLSLCFVEIDVKPYVGAMEGVVGGAVIGLAQGLVLRQRVEIAVWWVLASIVSWGLIGASNLGAIGWVAPRALMLEPRVISGVFFGLQVGAGLGVGQWLVLRHYVKRAIAWLLVSSLSWAIALPIGWALGGVLRLATHLFLSELVGLAVTWVIVAAITGIALQLLHCESLFPLNSEFRAVESKQI